MPNFHTIGFAEMYEWAETPLVKHGLFVQFDGKEPEKIMPFHEEGAHYAGVSTGMSVEAVSDDPSEWKCAYLTDGVGDIYMDRERLAVGMKQYDQKNEIAYIRTAPWEHFIKRSDPNWKKDVPYRKRSARGEWAKVNLIGKTIVIDDGTCSPGSMCIPYTGPDKSKWGHAVPGENGFYVTSRVSDSTIEIINRMQ